MRRGLLIEIISSLLILLFLYTGLSKLLEHDKFAHELQRSPHLSSVSGFISIALPAGEIILATLLFFKRTQLKGLWISLALLSLFTLYLIYMVSFSDNLPCSCGGVISQMTWTQHIFFNLFFVLLSSIGIKLSRRQIKQQRDNDQPPVVFT